ncbi:MAG TPA: glutamate racemase [Nevskiaceae bacterium]|nr:glutamate racemase [Nevskiaceae bacterium]
MIGVFDSGVGGLSVLHALRRELPGEDFLYYADSRHCPYGGQTAEAITARAVSITDHLIERGCRLIVVACNTATIAAIESLRAQYSLPFIGMEPALKPALAQTRSGVVGVLATGAALAGEKFHRLAAAQARPDARLITQPCPGLVEFVERGELDTPALEALLAGYVEPLLAAGADVLVLGCTHYPFLRPVLRKRLPAAVQLLDTGAAVARQTRRVLEREGLAHAREDGGRLAWETSGARALVAPVVERLLDPALARCVLEDPA